MCGLAINIVSFAHLLKMIDLNVAVDHLALMHIMKNEVEPANTKIKWSLEVLGSYSFNIYYIYIEKILS